MTIATQESKSRRKPAEGPQPDPPSLRTLAARRREAEATLEAIQAQERGAHDAAAAQDAQYHAEQAPARARYEAAAAELEKIDRWVEQERERELREAREQVERRHQTMEQLRELVNSKPPHIPMSRAEQAALKA